MSIGGIGNNYNMSVGNSLTSGNVSVQLIFAQLQMELAQANKDSALSKIDMIKERQAESKAITDAINNLRSIKTAYDNKDDIKKIGTFDKNAKFEDELKEANGYLAEAKTLQAQAKEGGDNKNSAQASQNKASSGEVESTDMTNAMESYYKKFGIDYDNSGKSSRQNFNEWNRAISNLDNRINFLEAAVVLQKNGIEIPEGKITSEDIDSLIASLESVQEQVGSNIQQEMIFVQDFMGQYNSFSQGASSAIAKYSDVLSALAQGR